MPQMVFMKKVMIPLVVSLLFLGIFTVLLPSGICEETNQNTLYVGGTGDGNYTSIQDAINNASDGDIVYVFSGSYYGNIRVNKSITLAGQDKNTTIIDGCAIISAGGVKINGFTINNPHDAGVPIDNGIEIWSNYSIVTNNIISNNNNGIYIPGFSNNLLYHNNFINNTQNAYDEGENTWYDITLNQGNYWDDYNESDKNNDGIGDTPYTIPGGDNQDKFPIMSPYYGRIIVEKYYVDRGSVQLMLVVGIICAIIFCLPIGLWWRKKYFK